MEIVQPTLSVFSLLYKGIIAAAVAGIAALIAWPFRKLSSIHEELTTQRTNCLQTLQDDGKDQVKLLGKAVDVLEAIHLGQVEMSGYIKAQNDHRS